MVTGLFSIMEMLADFNLIMKIFVLMTIISFIRNHLGTGPLAIAAMAGISWFVLFDYWKFFGGVFVLYTLLTFGVTSILIDFFFVSGGHGGPEEFIHQPGHGAELAHKLRAAEMARRSRAQTALMRRRFGG